MGFVRVGPEDFDIAAEMAALQRDAGDAGALASFVGIVRAGSGIPIAAMTLEHYPGMTDRAIGDIVAQAEARFALSGARVIHRTGRIPAGGRIVLVLAAAAHREAALDGTAFLIDWLKVSAPFWKKEHLADGSARWVDAREQDDRAAGRWAGG
ncbi:MAG TPA: molybdenum cofactor biosynthesis protein MoaE [Acidisoma sp.]|jgi:molybdopterin synthase catalytic subunit|nr:molybdenum cofactor biosynthesis protein MoaE [Acidisoma sp.]